MSQMGPNQPGGNVNSPGSAIIGQAAVADSADGKQLAYSPVTIDKTTGDVKNQRFTEQSAILFLKVNQGIKITSDGTITGALRNYLQFTTGDIIRFFHGPVSAPSLELDRYTVSIKPTTQSTSPATGAEVNNGGLGVAKNAHIGGNTFLHTVKAGATQAAAGAAANEIWKTSGHATLPDNVVMIGV